MKKLLIFILGMIFTYSCFSETATFRTGDFLALSITDYFFPVDINTTGSKCSITGIKKIEKDLWCFSITATRTGSFMPVIYDYYIKQGDTIKMRRINNPMGEIIFEVVSVNWNEIVLNIK